MNARLPLVLVVAALAGCGQAQTASRSPASAPSPARTAAPAPATTPTPDRTLIAVALDRVTAGLFTLDGREVARVTLPEAGEARVGGGMLTFVDGGVLKGLTRDGAVETLGTAGGPAVVSPDGQRWMWSTFTTSPGGATTSRLVLGGRGAPDRVVAEQTATGQALLPFRWTAAGPTYQRAALGIGGYILFGDSARGATYRFDPDTGRVSAVQGAGCQLADLSADGTVACFRPADHALAIVPAGGGTVAVPLPAPAFTQMGAASFGAAGSLVVGGATGAGANGGQERYELDVLDAGARTLRPLGPAGLRPAPGPWSWLPDGSLLAYRPAGAFGGDPGVYVVAPDGTARRVLASGTPLGAIA